MFVHKRLACHRIRELPGDRLHSFHQNFMNSETLLSSVFGNAYVSNLIETILKVNKDHLLHRERTDLARRIIHVESLNKCIDDL